MLKKVFFDDVKYLFKFTTLLKFFKMVTNIKYYTFLVLMSSFNLFSQNYDLYTGALNTAGDTWDVAISGSYAYVADGSYVRIVDISDVSNPTEVGSYAVADTAQGVFVSGNYLYVGDQNAGLLILDVTDKTNPTFVDSLYYKKDGTADWQNNYWNVIVSGNYAYVTAYKYFYIFDVSDPSSITHHGTFTCSSNCYEFDLDGDYAYIANTSAGLRIVDVSDPSSPTQVALLDDASGCCTGINDIVKSGNYAYAARYDNSSGNELDRLYIYDVSDPTSPSLLSYADYTKNYDGTLAPESIGFDGTYVYSSLWGIIQVHDVSNVNSPVLHALIEPNANTYQIDVSGDYIFLSNRSSGIQIIDTKLLKTVSRWTNSGGDNLWSNSSNWVNNTIPSSSDDVTILNGSSIIVDISTAVADRINIVNGGSLTINLDAGLSVSTDFANAGTTTMNSGGSLIVNGTASGTITYTRTLGTTNWYLVASPVIGQEINTTWADANGIASSGSNRAIAGYITQSDTWLYAQDGQSGETFQSGIGYSIKRSSSGNVSVTGTINTDNETETLTTTGNGFNLLGNPYPSYINSGSILSANSSSLDQQTIWLWNQATDSYNTKVTNDAFKIAPGQGFFVKSDGASGNVSILESYQSHESDTFQRPQVNPEIYLTLTDDSNTRYTRIKYNENATTGFDNGYDGSMFGATSNAFAIYTHLVGNEQGQVGNSQGHGYAVQSLPTDNYENMIVPVGINATRGTTINIEATLNNFPEGINVYLADKQENSVTLLETNTSYSTTLEEDLNGVGRFYIHTTPNALSNGEVMDNIPLSIYTPNSETLTIEGVATGTAYLQLYTMLGEELLRTSFEGTGVNEILLPNHLNPGIYIVKIATATGVTTKKIMIK